MDNIEPVSRIEQYLDRMANGGSGDLPTPVSRIEQYLNQIALGGGGGGSGLPSVSSSDLGAGLCVVKKAVEGAVIVPEQTVVCDEDNEGIAECSDVISSLFTTGAEVIAKMNGTSYTGVITDVGFSSPTFEINDLCSFYINDGTIYFYDDGWPSTVTVSLAALSYTYEWGIDPYAAWDFVAKVDWSEYTAEVVKGDYATVRAKLEAHTPCAFLVFGYGTDDSASDKMYTDIGYILEDSYINFRLSTGSSWGWKSDGSLETFD